MKGRLKAFVSFVSVITLVLTSCFVTKRNTSVSLPSFKLIEDTSTCYHSQFEMGYEDHFVGEQRNIQPSSNFHDSPIVTLLYSTDTALFFQRSDTIYQFGLFSQITQIIAIHEQLNNPPLANSIIYSNKGKVIYYTRKNIVMLYDFHTNALIPTNQPQQFFNPFVGFYSKITAYSDSTFCFTNNYITYITNKTLHVIDSFPFAATYTYPQCDAQQSRIISLLNFEKLLQGENEVAIYNTTSKTTQLYMLPIVEMGANTINAVRLSPVDTSVIYYCQNNSGIFSYNTSTKSINTIAESCPQRAFINFCVTPNGKAILAQTRTAIYAISNLTDTPYVRVLFE